MELVYRLEAYPELHPEEFVDLLERSTLAERRPVDEPETIRGMLVHADVIVTARARRPAGRHFPGHHGFPLLHLSFRPGGRPGMAAPGHRPRTHQRTHEAAGIHTTLILLSAPKAQTYYPHVGLQCPRLLLADSASAQAGP